MQVIIGGATYQPAPIKTQPIVYPANPSAGGTSVIGSPIQTPENAPTGIHAVVSTLAPIHALSGISVDPIPSGALDPIIGTSGGAAYPLSVRSVTSPSLAAVPQLATVPAPQTNYLEYAIYAALSILAYFLFRGE